MYIEERRLKGGLPHRFDGNAGRSISVSVTPRTRSTGAAPPPNIAETCIDTAPPTPIETIPLPPHPPLMQTTSPSPSYSASTLTKSPSQPSTMPKSILSKTRSLTAETSIAHSTSSGDFGPFRQSVGVRGSSSNHLSPYSCLSASNLHRSPQHHQKRYTVHPCTSEQRVDQVTIEQHQRSNISLSPRLSEPIITISSGESIERHIEKFSLQEQGDVMADDPKRKLLAHRYVEFDDEDDDSLSLPQVRINGADNLEGQSSMPLVTKGDVSPDDVSSVCTDDALSAPSSRRSSDAPLTG